MINHLHIHLSVIKGAHALPSAWVMLSIMGCLYCKGFDEHCNINSV